MRLLNDCALVENGPHDSNVKLLSLDDSRVALVMIYLNFFHSLNIKQMAWDKIHCP